MPARQAPARPQVDASGSVARRATRFDQELETYFRANRTKLIRAFLMWGRRDAIEDAVQEAVVRVYARYCDGEDEPGNLDAVVRVTIRNILIDGFRRARTVPIGDVRAGLDGEPVMVIATDDDEDFAGDPALPSKFVSAEEVVAWKRLLHALLDELDPKYIEIVSMAMLGATPEEIGEAYQQDGYVLRRYARKLLCRAIARYTMTGDPLAQVMERECCQRKSRPGPGKRI
jgi:RNA polymerase sigma factor (sigma-70 family)